MKYALGNMLNGAGGLNADGLSLDLQFATDKTLTARKGPTPTFTRASTATFVGSNGLIQSASVNAPRFDHDPLTLACKGLLIEEQRINSQRNSEDFSLWTNGIGTTTTTNQTTSPDGTSAADVFAETTANTQHFISDTLNVSVTSGTAYTLSVFAKKGIGATAPDLVQITGSGGAFGTTQYATFNIQNGSVNSSAGGTATIQSFGNGWYRLSFTVSATSTTTTALLISFVGLAPTLRLPSYIGLTTSDMYIWGAQFEAGSFPTSYIPTTTAAVTRSADVCSITGSAFSGFYNQAEGTILAGYLFRTNSAGRPFYIGDGTSSTNTMEAFNGGSGVTSNVFSGGAQQYTRDVVATNNSMVKTALAVAASNAMLAVNSTLATSGGGLMPVGVNQLVIGNRPDGARNINGHISVVRYFRKRLPNAKLQTLTAP